MLRCQISGCCLSRICKTGSKTYFLAWSNSVRRDLEALGVLESSGCPIDALLSTDPTGMTNEQLEVTLAFCKRRLAIWNSGEAKQSNETEAVAIEDLKRRLQCCVRE